MKLQNIIILLLSLIILSFSVSATTGRVYNTGGATYSEGLWDALQSAEFAVDDDWTSYGKCNETNASLDCLVMLNFTMPNTAYYDSVLWISNISNPQVVNTEDLWAQQDCWTWQNNNQIELMIRINNSAANNISYWCSVAENTWIEVGTAAAPLAYFFDSYINWTDNAPTVAITLPADGYTKSCNEEQTLDLLPVVFHANDTTDSELNCYLVVNGANQTSNSSMVNNTDTILYATLREGYNNSIRIDCFDEHGVGSSATRYVTGETCGECSDEFMLDVILLGTCLALLLWFAASFFNLEKVFKENWYIIMMLFVVMYILWYLANWQTMC